MFKLSDVIFSSIAYIGENEIRSVFVRENNTLVLVYDVPTKKSYVNGNQLITLDIEGKPNENVISMDGQVLSLRFYKYRPLTPDDIISKE